MTKKKNNFLVSLIVIIIIISIIGIISGEAGEIIDTITGNKDKTFRIISTTANRFFDDEIKEFAQKEKIPIEISYYGDLEIIDELNSETNNYDAVWISNSIWLYMLDNSYLVTNSKSIAVSPVVMGVKKSKAQSLGFVNNQIFNKDILNAIKEGKLKYVMNSVTKTNTGATAYLALLNSLAGSPEVLKSEMLKNQSLINDMVEFFKGVERVSGDETYLEEMFINGDYDAVINYESTLIELNNTLISKGKEPLYLLYPTDGVAINDMPFGYVNRNQNKEETFTKIQKFLRSKKTAKKLEQRGLRTWFGGVKEETDNTVFNKDWGIDTTKYLIPLKYPSKTVMNEAFDLYIEALRKPTHTVFVLDTSGSMGGSGLSELQEAMHYILDKEQARKESIQFSDKDKITIITFNRRVNLKSNTITGADTIELIRFIDGLYAYGDTNIYDPSVEALKILRNDSDDYMKVVILMTDGSSNYGSFSSLGDYYNHNNVDIPIYSITFGNSNEHQLTQIANLTNAKIFDGKSGLIDAFKEVRSYS